MDHLLGMKVFVRVAHHKGFAAAARELLLSPAAVSKHVTALEARVGARLFDRTTRQVGLTEAGRVYLERCTEALQALDDADASVGELARTPVGLLRVAAPFDFRHCIVPVVAELMHRNPGLVVDLRLSNRVVDLVEEGIDVGVRVAHSLDGAYVARPVARTRLAVYGSPAYLARHGRPRRPEDLAAHRAVVFTEPRPMSELLFTRDGREVPVKLHVVLMSNDGETLLAAGRHGIGLLVAPSFVAHGDAEAGVLEPLLLDWTVPEYLVYVVYPHRRFVSPKVRVLVDALVAQFGDGTRDPWWHDIPPASGPAHAGTAAAPAPGTR